MLPWDNQDLQPDQPKSVIPGDDEKPQPSPPSPAWGTLLRRLKSWAPDTKPLPVPVLIPSKPNEPNDVTAGLPPAELTPEESAATELAVAGLAATELVVAEL